MKKFETFDTMTDLLEAADSTNKLFVANIWSETGVVGEAFLKGNNPKEAEHFLFEEGFFKGMDDEDTFRLWEIDPETGKWNSII